MEKELDRVEEALGRSHGIAPGIPVRNNNRLENQTSGCLELPSLVLVTRSADCWRITGCPDIIGLGKSS
jgi:hypothetical protein